MAMLAGIEKSHHQTHHQSETETIKRSAKTAASVATTENAPEIFEPASLAGAWAEICDAPLAALLGFITVLASLRNPFHRTVAAIQLKDKRARGGSSDAPPKFFVDVRWIVLRYFIRPEKNTGKESVRQIIYKTKPLMVFLESNRFQIRR